MDSRGGLSRREVLAAAASAVAPTLAFGQVRGPSAPSNQTLVGCIGVGGRGSMLLQEAAAQDHVKITAVCDPFRNRREHWANWLNTRYGGKVCTPYRDLRELLALQDLDAVIIATPDHWHVPAALLAVRAGKDVYVEKPLGLSMEEIQVMSAAVNRHLRVFQYGTQQRSLAHVRHGAELVRNGRIGKVLAVEVTAPSYGFEGGSLEPMPVPENLDYDLWLGPARYRPYTKDRCTEWGAYWCSDNAHGFLGGWGSHPLTDMVWALGDGPQAVPVEFRGTGKFGTGLFDAPYDWKIEGRFANGATFHYVPGGDRTTLIGERGRVHISRGGLTTEPASLASERIGPDEKRLLVSDNHMGNFITAVRTRQPTVAPVEAAFLSDSIIQLSMIAIWTGRTIRWDPAREAIRDDSGAAQLLVRALRPPWHL